MTEGYALHIPHSPRQHSHPSSPHPSLLTAQTEVTAGTVVARDLNFEVGLDARRDDSFLVRFDFPYNSAADDAWVSTQAGDEWWLECDDDEARAAAAGRRVARLGAAVPPAPPAEPGAREERHRPRRDHSRSPKIARDHPRSREITRVRES